jgi:hypothetical protein
MNQVNETVITSRIRSRRWVQAVAAAAGVGVSSFATSLPAAGHHDGGANTFGTPNGSSDGNEIRLADHYIQEWTVWDTWAPIAVSDFDDYIDLAVEGIYDNKTDIVVNRAPRYTHQDVAYLSAYGSGNLTQCNLQTAAIYGSHPHRVCDHKVIWIDLNDWNTWNSGQRKYVAAHEFGHQLGLRHSNVGSGINASGDFVARVHPDPTGTMMHTGGFAKLDIVQAEINNINLHY